MTELKQHFSVCVRKPFVFKLYKVKINFLIFYLYTYFKKGFYVFMKNNSFIYYFFLRILL